MIRLVFRLNRTVLVFIYAHIHRFYAVFGFKEAKCSNSYVLDAIILQKKYRMLALPGLSLSFDLPVALIFKLVTLWVICIN